MAKIVQGTKLVPVASDTLIIKDSEDGDSLKEILYGNVTIDSITLTSTNGLLKTYTLWSDAAQTQSLGTFVVTDGIDGGIQSSTPSTDNNVVRFDGTNGDTVQNSLVNISDVGHMGIGTVSNNEAALAVKGTLDRQLSGTSSITGGTPVVSGLNTFYNAELNVNDYVVLDGIQYQVITIGSDTLLSVHINAIVDATDVLMYAESNLLELHRHDGGAQFTVDQDSNLVSASDITCINSYALGKMGIGTTSPDEFVHLKGAVLGSVRLKIENTDTTSNAQASFEIIQGNSGAWIYYAKQGVDAMYIWSQTKNANIATYAATGTITSHFDHIVSGKLWAGADFDVTGDAVVDGFTTLGDGNVAIKTKKLTGTTAATEGSSLSLAHGLTATKILSADCIVHGATSSVFANDTNTGDEYRFNITTSNAVLSLHATNAENLTSRAVTVLITYEE